MPEHLQRSADRLAAFRGAKAELEAEARGKLEAEQAERREAAGWEFTPRKDVSDAEPEPRAQRNFTDPESRIMLSGKNVVQAYNSQDQPGGGRTAPAGSASRRSQEHGSLPQGSIGRRWLLQRSERKRHRTERRAGDGGAGAHHA